MINTITRYIEESINEFRNVTWPTYNQAVKLTTLVLGFVALSALVIGGLDSLFNYIVTNIG